MKRFRGIAAALVALVLLFSATAMGDGAADAAPEVIASEAVEAAPGERVIVLDGESAQSNDGEEHMPVEHFFTLDPGEKRKVKEAVNVGDTLILNVDGATVIEWKPSPARAVDPMQSDGDDVRYRLKEPCKKLTLTAKLTGAANKKKSASLTLTVNDPFIPVDVRFTEDMPDSLPFGATLDLTGLAEPIPASAHPEMTWKASGAAKADKSGRLTTTKAGKATITATSAKNKKAKKTFTMQITPNRATVGNGAPGPEDIARFAGGWSLWLQSVEYTKKGLVCEFYVLNGSDEKCSQITKLGLRLCVGELDNEVASNQFSKVSVSVPARGSKLVKITLPVYPGASIPDLSRQELIYFDVENGATLKGKKAAYPYQPQQLPDFPGDGEVLNTSEVDGEIWVEGLLDENVEELVIPAELNGMPVVKVNVEAFRNNKHLRRVVMPEGLRAIGRDAFDGCENLQRVVIPSTVTEIGGAAFRGCAHLEDVTLPEGIQYILGMTFQGCAALRRANIPATVTGIEDHAFYGCESLGSLVLPDGLKKVGLYAFANCDSLKNVHIPKSLTDIGVAAFGYCDSLTEITVDAENPAYAGIDGALYTGSPTNPNTLCICPAGMTGGFQVKEGTREIDTEAFGGCGKLTSIKLAESVSEIGSRAFDQCDGVTNIEIKSNVPMLHKETFYQCQKLYSITVRAYSTQLDKNFFVECPKFGEISGSAGSRAESWFNSYGAEMGVSFDYIGE